ncbi:41406_t:CDS:1, partial [Gigaspora margarita]
MPKIGEYLFEGNNFKVLLFGTIGFALVPFGPKIAQLRLFNIGTEDILKIECYLEENDEEIIIPF